LILDLFKLNSLIKINETKKNKCMKKILFIIFVLTANIAFAQRTVTGLITDELNQPVEGVTVSIKNCNSETVTDVAGKYSIAVPENCKTLEFSKEGFKVQVIDIESDVVNLTMLWLTEYDLFELSLEELMNVEVITATKQIQKKSEAPAIISIITAEQILQRGYSTVGEAINSLPGIYVLDDHLQQNIGVRGINGGMQAFSRIVKVMVDNQPVSFRSTTENWLGVELIPITAIDHIEIVRGPASTLYGANAFLGVINIITKQGNSLEEGIISGEILSNNNNIGAEGNFVFGKNFERSQFLISYQGNHIDKSGIRIKNMPGNTYYDENLISKNDINFSQSVFAKYRYSSEKNDVITFSYHLQNFNNYGEFQDYSILSHTNHIVMNNSYGKLEYNKIFINNLSFKLSVATAYGKPKDKQTFIRKPELEAIPDTIKRDFGFHSYDFTTELSYMFKTDNSLTFGADFTTDNQNLQTYYQKDYQENYTIPLQSIEYGDTTFNNWGIYLQGIFYPFQLLKTNFLNNLSITTGIRYDNHNIYGNTWNHRFALVYPFTENFYVKALFGQSFKAPASVQLYTNALYTRGIIGNSNLEPEKANTYEILLSLNLSNQFNLSFNVFKNDVFDKVEIMPFGSNYAATNIAQINSLGVESELTYINRFSQNYINFSYQKSTFEEEDPIISSQTITRHTRLFPTMMVKGGTNFTFKKIYTSINIEGKYIDEIIASAQNLQKYDGLLIKEYSLPSYLLFDVTISSHGLKIWSKNETIFQFAIKNVLDTEYVMPGYKNFDIYGNNRCFSLKLIQLF